jgi:glutamate-ammonia-ligase adenylyltransferase
VSPEPPTAPSSDSLAGRLDPDAVPALPKTRLAPRLAEIAQAARKGGPELAGLFDRLPKLATFLATVADSSPFLRSLIVRDGERLTRVLASSPAALLREVSDKAREAWRTADEPALMAALRRARAEVALTVALADLGAVLDLDAVTGALTAFADAALGAATDFALFTEHQAGRLRLPDPENPSSGSGLFFLGMGKYGAAELNYSSDIDLIVLFERDIAPLAEGTEPTKLFVRVVQRVSRILQERTSDGYVFRVDLRLRPDPGSTQVAISTDAALRYYEGLGQNWERAAMIKARAVAGDIAVGEAFLAELAPFIWRKYLDYAAIADVHSIKRQIHDHRGHGEIAIAGHNLKLGAGGIREVEFFVQTQQLIAGGRNPSLRGRRTVDMLAALAREGWIDRAAAKEMTAAYTTLRTIEHRLQMIADEQTHSLPSDEEGLAAVARLCGYRSADRFGKSLREVLEGVQGHYAKLFEAAPALSTETGSLVFTGDDDDPGTVATLTRLGYSDPSAIIAAVRGWHFGRVPAMRSVTARERLTEITPTLLQTFATLGNADATFLTFDRFLARLPAGVQLFSLLASNQGLLSLLAEIMGTAPRLANTIVKRAHVLDALIEPAFFGRLPDAKFLRERLAANLTEARSYEEMLNQMRVFQQEQALLIGVRLLAGAVTTHAAGRAYADLAEAVLAELFPRVRAEFARAHGKMPGGEVALLALGKLGGREMTAASDLDLILVYDHDEAATASDGARPLSGSQYFARLTQRLVAALSAPTSEGRLYEVDFRLRPSGNSGPLASRLPAFVAYQRGEAWTWEHMALTRARVMSSDKAIVSRVRKEVRSILTRRREAPKIKGDIVEMRSLIASAKGGGGVWDLKQAPGGLVDVEFVAQGLQLLHGAEHASLLSTETEASLRAALDAGVLPPAEADILLPGLQLQQSLTEILRLCLDGPFVPAEAPKGLLALLARVTALPDFPSVEAHLKDTQRDVRRSFERLIGKVPAAKS